jgi:hypothetical protein
MESFKELLGPLRAEEKGRRGSDTIIMPELFSFRSRNRTLPRPRVSQRNSNPQILNISTEKNNEGNQDCQKLKNGQSSSELLIL